MFRVARSTKKEATAAQVIPASPKPSPDLPTEITQHIAGLSVRYHDLSTASVVSRSWYAACKSLITDVQSVALNCTSAPLVLKKETCLAFAQDFAVRRLLRKTAARDMKASEHANLSSNLPQLWSINKAEPSFDELCNVFLNSKEVDTETWYRLLTFTAKKRAMKLLAFDLEGGAAFHDLHREAIRDEVAASIEKFLNEGSIELSNCPGGALRDYASTIAKFGAKTTPPYCSPFHRILFASLLYRPQAFHGLIEISADLCGADFFDFRERVSGHYKDDGNVLLSLNMATANWFAKATAKDMSSIPLALRMEAISQVYRQYLQSRHLSMAQTELVIESRRACLLGIAQNVTSIVTAIPSDELKCRKKLLKPLMKFLRSNAKSDSEIEQTRLAIEKQLEAQKWLSKPHA